MVVTGVSVKWAPWQRVLGRATPAFYIALPSLLMAGFGLLVLALISSWVATHWRSLASILTVSLLAYCLIREGLGGHHSVGEPQLPMEPRP